MHTDEFQEEHKREVKGIHENIILRYILVLTGSTL